MADVFISYHRETMAGVVRQIAAEFDYRNEFENKERKISYWYDTNNQASGRFPANIEEEIKRCKAFLFIWDDGANNSDWCRDEVASALNHRKTMFPFRVGPLSKEDNELSFRLRSFHVFGGENLPEPKDIRLLVGKIHESLSDNPLNSDFIPILNLDKITRMLQEATEQRLQYETETQYFIEQFKIEKSKLEQDYKQFCQNGAKELGRRIDELERLRSEESKLKAILSETQKAFQSVLEIQPDIPKNGNLIMDFFQKSQEAPAQTPEDLRILYKDKVLSSEKPLL